MSEYLHKSMKEVSVDRVAVRRAKRQSKCAKGCIIPIGDIVVITDFEIRNNHSQSRNFNVRRPQRFCEKHGQEFLCSIEKIVNDSMIKINRLSEENN